MKRIIRTRFVLILVVLTKAITQSTIDPNFDEILENFHGCVIKLVSFNNKFEIKFQNLLEDYPLGSTFTVLTSTKQGLFNKFGPRTFINYYRFSKCKAHIYFQKTPNLNRIMLTSTDVHLTLIMDNPDFVLIITNIGNEALFSFNVQKVFRELRELPVTSIFLVATASYESYMVCAICDNGYRTIPIHKKCQIENLRTLWTTFHKNSRQHYMSFQKENDPSFDKRKCGIHLDFRNERPRECVNWILSQALNYSLRCEMDEVNFLIEIIIINFNFKF